MNFSIVSKLLTFFSLLPHLFSASVPYAGKVSIDGVNYHGEAIFAFEIMDKEGTVHWRNGEAVQDGISIFVRNGRYSVELGEQGTKPLSEDLFLLKPELYLKVRIDLKDGKGYRHLAPDQRIGSTTHALSAEVARRLLPGSVSDDMLNERFRKYAEATFKPRVIKPFQDLSLTEGDSINVEANVEGEYLSYRWYKNGELLHDQIGSELSFAKLNPVLHNGNYKLVASNDWGQAISQFNLDIDWNKELLSIYSTRSYFPTLDGKIMGGGSTEAKTLGNGVDQELKQPKILPHSDIVSIASGLGTIYLKEDGSLWGFGTNSAGYFGTDLNGSFNFPQPIFKSKIKSISAQVNSSFVIKDNGSLWAAGQNNYGQLGDGTTDWSSSFKQIVPYGVAKVDNFSSHTLYLKSDGTLWGMGKNNYGQLGDGTTVDKNTSVLISDENIIDFAAGGRESSYYVKSDGSLHAIGRNNHGQLGDGTTEDRNTSIEIVDGNVTAVDAGGGSVLFTKSDGSLWGIGRNSHGQLGIGNLTDQSNPVQIINQDVIDFTCGLYAAMFRKNDGSVWVMGRNSLNCFGEIDDDDDKITTPFKIWPKNQRWVREKLNLEVQESICFLGDRVAFLDGSQVQLHEFDSNGTLVKKGEFQSNGRTVKMNESHIIVGPNLFKLSDDFSSATLIHTFSHSVDYKGLSLSEDLLAVAGGSNKGTYIYRLAKDGTPTLIGHLKDLLDEITEQERQKLLPIGSHGNEYHFPEIEGNTLAIYAYQSSQIPGQIFLYNVGGNQISSLGEINSWNGISNPFKPVISEGRLAITTDGSKVLGLSGLDESQRIKNLYLLPTTDEPIIGFDIHEKRIVVANDSFWIGIFDYDGSGEWELTYQIQDDDTWSLEESIIYLEKDRFIVNTLDAGPVLYRLEYY